MNDLKGYLLVAFATVTFLGFNGCSGDNAAEREKKISLIENFVDRAQMYTGDTTNAATLRAALDRFDFKDMAALRRNDIFIVVDTRLDVAQVTNDEGIRGVYYPKGKIFSIPSADRFTDNAIEELIKRIDEKDMPEEEAMFLRGNTTLSITGDFPDYNSDLRKNFAYLWTPPIKKQAPMVNQPTPPGQ